MRCPSLRRQKRKSAKMRMKVMSLKMKMREKSFLELPPGYVRQQKRKWTIIMYV